MSTCLFRGHYVYPLGRRIQDDFASRLRIVVDCIVDSAEWINQLRITAGIIGVLAFWQQSAVFKVGQPAHCLTNVIVPVVEAASAPNAQSGRDVGIVITLEDG